MDGPPSDRGRTSAHSLLKTENMKIFQEMSQNPVHLSLYCKINIENSIVGHPHLNLFSSKIGEGEYMDKTILLFIICKWKLS